MNTPQYEIFSGHNHRDAVWLEAIEGMDHACERMKAIASEFPGPYFVFCRKALRVLFVVDTSRPRDNRHKMTA